MFQYTNEQLASVVALPIVTILLVWTSAIFHRNRKRWGPYDIPIFTLLVLSIVRNLTVLTYTLFITLNQSTIDIDYCSGIVWIFNSIHTFQACSLTTLAIIGLFSIKLKKKQQHIRQFLTPTHLIYHLFCLTTLCACVGVAAILAQNGSAGRFNLLFDSNPCKFLPFDLDLKFNVFVLVLNVFLALVSVFSFVAICVNYVKIKRNGFDYLKKSTSDLSDLSLENNKNYYDTYTIQRGGGGSGQEYETGQNTVWNSDVSNISTTVSSTNSRRPCIAQTQHHQQQKKVQEENRTGLETIHPVLIVCYLFYHLPLIVLCSYPNLVAPWPVAGVALWLGLVQDLLIPIGLSLVDSRFCKWVSNVYRCSDKHDDKLPHVGLDGKFRPFSSQPQSLEVNQPHHQQQIRGLQAVEHRFPITNGSLYTSIDGRLPVIHNYRRHKEQRGVPQTVPHHHNQPPHLCRPDYVDPYHMGSGYTSCRSCETDLCPSHSNLHHLSPHYANKNYNLIQQQNNNILINAHNPLIQRKPISLSRESLRYGPEEVTNPIIKNSRNLVRLNRMRLCKSEDSLNSMEATTRELRDLKHDPRFEDCSSIRFDRDMHHPFGNNQNFFEVGHHHRDDCHQQRGKDDMRQFEEHRKRELANEQILDYTSSEEEYPSQNFGTLSSQSSFSITTEANCDFEFYKQDNNNKAQQPENKHQKAAAPVQRSNSQIQSLFDESPFLPSNKIQRSNSYMTLEDRQRARNGVKKLLRSDSKLSDCTHNIRQKVKSVEYLPSSNASTVYIEDVYYFNYPNKGEGIRDFHQDNPLKNHQTRIGSVPDLKKVFISEYI